MKSHLNVGKLGKLDLYTSGSHQVNCETCENNRLLSKGTLQSEFKQGLEHVSILTKDCIREQYICLW